jgi:hypothetical protein
MRNHQKEDVEMHDMMNEKDLKLKMIKQEK